MQIHNENLRDTYFRIKAAKVVQRIREVIKSPHAEGKLVEVPEEDDIRGVPDSGNNNNETDVDEPTAHNTPADPEYDTPNTIAGTGSGPTMEEQRTNHN